MFIYVSTFPCDYWEPTQICWVQTSNVGRGAYTLAAVLQTNQVVVFLKLSSLSSPQGWGVHVPFTKYAKAAFDNVEQNSEGYTLYEVMLKEQPALSQTMDFSRPHHSSYPQAICAIFSATLRILSSSFLPPCNASSPCNVLLCTSAGPFKFLKTWLK